MSFTWFLGTPGRCTLNIAHIVTPQQTWTKQVVLEVLRSNAQLVVEVQSLQASVDDRRSKSNSFKMLAKVPRTSTQPHLHGLPAEKKQEIREFMEQFKSDSALLDILRAELDTRPPTLAMDPSI